MKSLLDKSYEHDNCGIGAVVSIDGIRTHQTVSNALHIVEKLDHRAGRDGEGTTGDGVGILIQIPDEMFRKEFNLPNAYGVGMFFFPTNEKKRHQDMKMFEVICKKEGLDFIKWRKVPVDESVISKKALDSCPSIYQGFVYDKKIESKGLELDRHLYVARRIFESSAPETYVCSFSSRTIVYKGMFLVDQLRKFYPDLQSEDCLSSIALVHSRFSTNTNPSWRRAHPNRLLMHNGEINTIKGNSGKMFSREETMYSDIFKEDIEKIYPVVDITGSDSAMLDNTIEFMMMAGMSLPEAIMKLIPEPWQNEDDINPNVKAFYEYNATMMEPWDGPASIIFSDGDVMGAILDRNGLRPSRYYVTKDHYLILSSEVGVLPIEERNIEKKDRLRPGRILLVDTKQKRIISDEEIKTDYSSRHPYGEWLKTNLLHLKDLKMPNKKVPTYSNEELNRLKKMFDYSYEDVYQYIYKLALDGQESVISMGVDIPLAVMDKNYQPLFNYFKQLFAQVTNPPFDSLREKIITSSDVYIGKDGNLLKDVPENCHQLKIENPILSNWDMVKIRNLEEDGFKVADISILYYKHTPIERALQNLFHEVDKALKNNATILILSDRGVDEYHVPLPSLLAVSAVHQYLLKTKRRLSCTLIIETAEPKEVHHFATLLGYGASAINGYLCQDVIKQLCDENVLNKDYYAAVKDFNHGIMMGIVKIASKMGISTLQSYKGSQNFEAIGIDESLVKEYFGQTISRIGGITLKDIEEKSDHLHDLAFDEASSISSLDEFSRGEHRSHNPSEEHIYDPEVIHLLQKSVRTNDYQSYLEYAKLVDEKESHAHLRGMMEFASPRPSIPLEEVESEYEIVKRFKTGAMSFGSISPEAHKTMAIAMNALHAKSNSGEGGEEESRYLSLDGEDCSSHIKQVASGRFGVTSNYLNHCDEIQIKMAQGAKPGEGGQLPGAKVYPWVAKARHATPGVSLISPPPHHDIYSIEDLAELIYDLKCANDKARISVKLVSQAGVGTVACGVAKAGSQVILISGFDGGTGAAPKNAVYNAGLPWELGLSESHQALLENGLRDKVTLETDGKLMTGRDVVIACLLGAEEFGFASVALVSMGCLMMKVCSLDTCPVGVATQNPELRKYFKGKPEHVMNFMLYTARQVREIMASLGFHNMKEMCGHIEVLKAKHYEKGDPLSCISLENILGYERKEGKTEKSLYDFKLENKLDSKLLKEGLFDAIQNSTPYQKKITITNTDRAFGTLIGSRISRTGKEYKDNTFTLDIEGSAGQSFGAFIPKGLTLKLNGDANDYLGKGLSGGIISVSTPRKRTYSESENIIIGNVAMYGATSGQAYINGEAGERFCVRNSGADCVVEGCGDHALEYMTGGTVLILGKTGRNLAAGMSGGIAYVYDPNNVLYTRLNTDLVKMEYVIQKADEEKIASLLKNHIQYTGSSLAKKIYTNLEKEMGNFKAIIPVKYREMLKSVKAFEALGMKEEEAKLAAFEKSIGGNK